MAAAAEPSSREILEAAARVCTEKQLEALVLYETGLGVRRLAAALGVNPTAARDRLDGGMRKVQRELERAAT